MWTTGATHMIARLTGSTLFANHNLASIFTFDHRSVTTTTDTSNLLTKMRDLRARSPYALFLKDNYSEISAKYPNLKLVDISKKVAEVWKSLPDEKKQTYAKKSQDQKANYEQEKKRLSSNDLQTVDAAEKAKRIESRIKKSVKQLPTKPRSAYVHFLSSLDRGEADLRDFMKGAAQRWSHMSVEEKKKFEDIHQEEYQKYVKALVAWASSMEQESKSKSPSRRSSSTGSTKTKAVKKTRGTSAVKKRTTASPKPTKSTKTKSSKTKSDEEISSSSSSDDESSPRMKKSIDSKKS